MNATPLDLRKLVVFDGYHGASRYERLQRLVTDPQTLGFHGTDLAVGGSLRVLAAASYGLKVDGAVVATAPVVANATGGSFTVPTLTPGWHRLDIVCGPGETAPTWFVAVGAFLQTMMPVYDGSFSITHGVGSIDTAVGNPLFTQHWDMVPAVYAPVPRPLPLRVHTPFSTAVPYAQLYRRELVPVTIGDSHRPNVNKDGIVSTANRQSYFFGDVYPFPAGTPFGALISKFPAMPLLDGPRAVGTLMMATHLEPGGTKGGTWFCDPWRFGRISGDGKIKTMIGYLHDAMPPHWEDTPSPKLLGDWSALAVKGFHELWGMAWWKRTLALDMNAPPINGEQPHIVGPQAFFADSQNNRVLRATWSPTDRSIPPVITLFASGLDAWDVVEGGDKVYISFRGEHRVAEHDAATGAFVRDVVKGAALAHVDSNRIVQRDATDAMIQAQPIVSPEGLFLQDGVLSIASLAMKQVRDVNLTTGANTLACSPQVGGNSRFMKITRSDGMASPRGTYFTSTFENAYFGMPEAFLPGGAKWDWFNYGPFSCGKGGRWDALGYSTACGASDGRIVCGASSEGVVEYSLALPSDSAKDEAKYVAGRNQYWAKGYALLHGELGFGNFGLPLPMGETPEMDYFLDWNLFASETAAPPPVDCSAVQAQRDAALVKIANFKAALQ